MRSNAIEGVLALHDAGLSVIPAAIDGTKAPLGRWQQYQSERMPVEQLRGWLGSGHPGWGVVTGAVSGNLEMFEFEGRAVTEGLLPAFVALAQAAGLTDVVQRLMTGYMETTPSGGIHLLYRVDGHPVPGNTKLAKRPARDDELVEHELKARETKPDAVFARTLIETRGERGFVVTAPSGGTTHETGRPWTLVAGGPASIPTITAEEHAALHQLAATFDQMPHADPSAVRFAQPATGARPEGGVSPGDDYEARTDWAEILTPHGWTCVAGHGNTRYWRRPGKRLGVSATTGAAQDRDRLYVFTTSTIFESEIPYTKFGAYALLEHGGDHSAAAKALHTTGYGTPAPEPARPAQFVQPGAQSPNEHHGGADEQPAPAAAAQVSEPSTYSLTDDGNALRLIDEHHDTIRYCPERASWLIWSGHRWEWDEAGHVQELTRHIARTLPENDRDQRNHRKASLSARGLTAAMQVARTDPRTVAPIRRLDAGAYDLNTPGGLVDLRTGTIRPPDPAALCARSTSVAPDFDARPDRWHQFLSQTFAGDAEMTTYVQRLIGVSLVGAVLEQLLPFPYGTGANGKSTLMGVIMRVLGIGDDGYALSAPAELLLATAHNDHPTEIARLSGTRFVVTSELEDGQKFAEARIKQLTGGDPIAARFMRGDYFTFVPTHTIWMPGNHQPAVRSGGPAFWRRLRLLPFLHTVPPEEKVKGLEELLYAEEGPGILAWAIQGAADYFAYGNEEPESVKAATNEYQQDQDALGRFVEEMCETGSSALPHMFVKAKEIRAVYEAWCHSEGESTASVKAFSMALQKRWNVVVERAGAGRTYRGIRLTNPASDDDDPTSNPAHGTSGDSTIGGRGW